MLDIRNPDHGWGRPTLNAAMTAHEQSDTIASWVALCNFFGGETLYIPKSPGNGWALKAEIPLEGTKILGDGGFGDVYNDSQKSRTRFDVQHTGHGFVLGQGSGLIHCAVRGQAAAADKAGVRITGSDCILSYVSVTRGGRAAVWASSGGNHLSHVHAACQSGPWHETEGAAYRLDGGFVDSTVEFCFGAAHGPCVWLAGANNTLIGNIFYNSQVGILLTGAWNSIVGGRIDQCCHEGILVDWGAHGNTITGVAMHSNGARITVPGTTPAEPTDLRRRCGIRLASGHGNAITGVALNNRYAGVTQEDGTLNFNDPQVHGIVTGLIGAEFWDTARTAPTNNRLGGCTIDRQLGASVFEQANVEPLLRDVPVADHQAALARIAALEAQAAQHGVTLTGLSNVVADLTTSIVALNAFRTNVKGA